MLGEMNHSDKDERTDDDERGADDDVDWTR